MIKVYSKAGCPQCDVVKTWLTQNGYTNEEVRIDEDDTAKEFLIGEGNRSVPQMYLDEQLLIEGGAPALKQMTTKQLALRIREVNGN